MTKSQRMPMEGTATVPYHFVSFVTALDSDGFFSEEQSFTQLPCYEPAYALEWYRSKPGNEYELSADL